MMYRMKIPLVNIRNKISADPGCGFTKEDIELFASEKEIEEANHSLNVMWSKTPKARALIKNTLKKKN